MNKRFKQHDLTARIRSNRNALWIEVLLTCVIAVLVVFLSLSSLTQQAEFAAGSVKTDYDLMMREYVRVFDTAFEQISEKIEADPSFEEMDAWLKSMDAKWAKAMGEDIFDGISFTYKGGFARSWENGDYSNYDPTTRRWYQAAEAAGGKTAIIAPYVTFLDAQMENDESYILMSIVRKYDDTIYVDYDVKLPEIRDMMENRHLQYRGTELILFDEEGYVLSSSNGARYAHNLNKPDKAISQNLCEVLQSGMGSLDRLTTVLIDGELKYLYTTRDDSGNYVAVIVSFVSVFLRDFLAITLIAVALLIFEIFLYRRNRRSLLEYRYRDERLSAVTNATFQGKLYVDLESDVFYGSSEAEEMCPGGSYEELFTKFCSRLEDPAQLQLFADFVSPAALHSASGNMYRLETHRFAMRWKMPDGSRQSRTIEVGRLASVIDSRETVAVLCRDVSEDAEILKEALKQAESASRAKGDFMSRMSHEIRTPLNAIIGYLDIAQGELTDADKVSHCLSQSQVASRHLLSIINDVLDISSIESGRMKIAREDFDLTQLVDALTTIFYAQTQRKHIHFETTVSDLTEEWVEGDSLRVNQILMNLLSNAVKFTPEAGEVRLDIRQVGVHDGKVHMQFKVSDTGIGMSEGYKQRIFHPFEQESAGTARSYGGTGLGLSICHNLVEMMGGSIEVESEQGKGTVFTVLLAFGQTTARHEGHLGTDSFGRLHALVVDDEENTCEYVQKLLSRCGIKSDTVTSGKKALRRVKSRMDGEHPYDFCIIDWNMPEMNGVETAKEIRKLGGTAMPIIIATAYDYSAIVDEAKAAGVDKIVSKPLFQSTVFDMLVNTFGKYEPSGAQPKEKQKADFHGMRVLLAEDNAMNMEIARDILQKAGMVVTPAENGQVALDKFKESAPGDFEAILMDIQMPVMDGYTAARAIRRCGHPQAETIPIIAMTANAFTSDVTAALAAGMNDHIAKPVSYDRLFAALTRLTAKHEMEQETRLHGQARNEENV